MIVTDERGRLLHEAHEATTGLAGRRFRRLEPRDGWAENVVVTGVTDTGDADRGPVAELVLEAADFGNLVDGFDAIASIDFDTFAEEYVELHADETAMLHAAQVVASIEATHASEAALAERPTWKGYR